MSDPAYTAAAVPSGKEVPLVGLPEDVFDLASFQWTADDRLIVEGTAESLRGEPSEGAESGSIGDLSVVPFVCTIPEGSCERIARRELGKYGESSARGQAVANLPPDYQDEGE